MSAEQLAARVLSEASEIPSEQIRKGEEKHGIEKVGAKLRGMMSWLGKKAKSVGKGVSQASYVSTSK